MTAPFRDETAALRARIAELEAQVADLTPAPPGPWRMAWFTPISGWQIPLLYVTTLVAGHFHGTPHEYTAAILASVLMLATCLRRAYSTTTRASQ